MTTTRRAAAPGRLPPILSLELELRIVEVLLNAETEDGPRAWELATEKRGILARLKSERTRET